MAKSKTKILEDARKYVQKGKWDKAIAEYEELLEIEPDDPTTLNSIGDLYTKLNQMSKATDFFRKSIDLYSEISLFNNAIAVCKKILRADPNQNSIYKKLAELYKDQGLTNDAIRHFMMYADKMREKDRMDEVLQCFKEVVELSPANIDTRMRLVELYVNQGHTPEAITELQVVIKHHEENGNREKADEARRRIAELDPSAVVPESEHSEEMPSMPEEEEPEEEQLEMAPPDEEDGDMLRFTPSSSSKIGFGHKEPEELEEDAGLSLEMSEDSLPPIEEISTSFSEEEPVEEISTSFSEEEPVQEITMSSDEEEPGEFEEEAPPVGTKPFVPAQASIQEIRLHLSHQPDDFDSRYELGLKLRKTSPDEAVDELIETIEGFFALHRYDKAATSVEKALEIVPNNLFLHKKNLEVVAHLGDPNLLIRAYLNFGDSLSNLGESSKAEFVYQKVLSIDPNNKKAKEKIERHKAPAVHEIPAVIEQKQAAAKDVVEPQEAMVDLAALLSEDDDQSKSKSDKIRIERKEAGSSTELDDIISDFKAGVQEHVEEEDYASHYDLGLAYKEMGLVDEAIGEFQIATRGSKQRLRAFEMLGQCFLEKNELELALKQFKRGIATPGHSEFEYLGLHYNIGLVNERTQNWAEAKKAYEEVYVVDISFNDIAERIATVQKHLDN